MTKTVILMTTSALAAAALSACTPPTPQHHRHWRDADMKSISKLDCPDAQGALKRQSAAADGKSCVYGDANGGVVTLQVVSLDGTDPQAALNPLETQLRA